jgi:hemolysin activation/secretion protein
LPLDIRARERSAEVSLTRKFIDAPLLPRAETGGWSPARTLSGGLVVTRRVSTSYLLGAPFSFSAGSVNGRSEYTALRLVGDYLVRNVDQVFAVSVTGSRGLDGSRSDVPGVINPKRHFQAVLAQVNYARRLSDKGLEFRARLSGQLADSTLYSGERFSAGGATTVRGFRENLLLADQGVVGSLELAQPISLSAGQGHGRAFDWGAFSVSVFTDGARLHNHEPPQPGSGLYSVGGSLAWIPSDAISAQVTYGRALNKRLPVAERDIQDRGFQFRITVHPLRMGL